MKIFLDDEAKKSTIEIMAYLDYLSLHDCNFGNREYFIEDGEYTYIDDCEEDLGALVLQGILRIANKEGDDYRTGDEP